MALYFSRRLFEQYTGIHAEQLPELRRTDDVSHKVSGRASGEVLQFKGEAGAEATRAIGVQRPVTDSDLVAILEQNGHKPRLLDEDVEMGDLVQVWSYDWRQGCVPVMAVNHRHRHQLTAYMGMGTARTEPRSWWGRLAEWLTLTKRPLASVRIQAFGSADNFTEWRASERQDRIETEGWYPSSPNGLARILGAEANLPQSDIDAEVELDNGDSESSEFLCDRFDYILGSRFNNSHDREVGKYAIDSVSDQMRLRVRIIGLVYGLERDQLGLIRVLLRPLMITAA